MAVERIYRSMLIAAWVCAVIGGNLDRYILTPEERAAATFLEAAVAPRLAIPWILEVPLPIWFVFFMLLVGVAVIAVHGLFNFKPWSRTVAVVITGVGLAFHLLPGATVQSHIAGAFVGATLILWGAALAMAYTPPLAARFEQNARGKRRGEQRAA